MNPEIIYLIKVNVGIALFYAFYKLFFHKDTFFVWRRVALLAFLAISLLYPLLNLQDWVKTQEPMQYIAEAYSAYLPEVVIQAGGTNATDSAQTTSILPQLLLYLYGAVVILLIARLIAQLTVIIKLAKRSASMQEMGVSIRHISDNKAPFSFFKWIFIHPESHTQTQLEEILTHECTHVRQWHSVDIIVYELTTILCWFNPFVWLMRREVRSNLEFLADQQVIEKGFDTQTYQYHLLGLSHPHQKEVATLYNNFNVLPLKNRIKMMNKKRSKDIGRTKYLMFVPLVALLLMVSNIETIAREAKTVFSTEQSDTYLYTGKVVNKNGKPIEGAMVSLSDNELNIKTVTNAHGLFEITSAEKGKVLIVMHEGIGTITPVEKYTKGMNIQFGKVLKEEDQPYEVVEEMPSYPGGMVALMEYLQTNIKYPAEAVTSTVEGRVIVQFVVNKEGNIIHPKVVRSINPLLDEEAIRVISLMPKWNPGKQGGKNVSVKYTLPVNFKL